MNNSLFAYKWDTYFGFMQSLILGFILLGKVFPGLFSSTMIILIYSQIFKYSVAHVQSFLAKNLLNPKGKPEEFSKKSNALELNRKSLDQNGQVPPKTQT